MYWCGRKDSNLHALASASPSSWCVCQFRHFREVFPRTSYHRGWVVVVVGGLAGVAGAGVAGADDVGFGGGAAVPPTTELPPRWPMIDSASAPSMKSTAQTVV